MNKKHYEPFIVALGKTRPTIGPTLTPEYDMWFKDCCAMAEVFYKRNRRFDFVWFIDSCKKYPFAGQIKPFYEDTARQS